MAGKFDAVLDTVSSHDGPDPDYEPVLRGLLKSRGQYMALNGAKMDFLRSIILRVVGLPVSRPQYDLVLPFSVKHTWLDEINSWLSEATHVRPILDSTRDFSEDELAKAIDLVKSRRARGKVVLTFPELKEA
eukprot:g24860.t1